MRNAPLLALALLLALPLLGQDRGQRSPVVNDNMNCRAPVGAVTGGSAGTWAAPDGTLYSLNSAHILFAYTKETGWARSSPALQSAGGYPLMHVSVGSASQVLALSTAAPPSNNLYVLNSTGTAWRPLSAPIWLALAEIGADGSIWGISAKQIYNWTGSAWTAVPGHLDNLAVALSTMVWGVNSSGVLEKWNGTAWVARSPALPFPRSHAENAIHVDWMGGYGLERLALLDSGGGFHVSENAGQSWPTMPTADLLLCSPKE